MRRKAAVAVVVVPAVEERVVVLPGQANPVDLALPVNPVRRVQLVVLAARNPVTTVPVRIAARQHPPSQGARLRRGVRVIQGGDNRLLSAR